MNCHELLGSEDWAEDIQLIIMKDLQWLPLDRSFLAFVSLKSFTEGYCPCFFADLLMDDHDFSIFTGYFCCWL